MIEKIYEIATCFAKRYYYKIYDNYQNSFTSFRFLLNCLFASKKQNELVDHYIEFVIKNIQFYRYTNYESLYDILMKIPITKIKENLENPKHSSFPQKLISPNDLKMLLNIFEFILEKKIDNFCKFLSNEIQKSVKRTYNELRKIHGIGDKTASLIIRDFLLLNYEIFINEDDYQYAFPVDSWIKRIAKWLNPGLTTNIKEFFINECRKKYLDIIETNTGLWYIGHFASNLVAKYFNLHLNRKKAREFLIANIENFWKTKLSLKEKIKSSKGINRLKYLSNPNIPLKCHMPDIKSDIVERFLYRELNRALNTSNNIQEAVEKAINKMKEKYQIELYYRKTDDESGTYRVRIYNHLWRIFETFAIWYK